MCPVMNNIVPKDENLLPEDGTVNYYCGVLDRDYFGLLLEDTPWNNDELVIFGKHVVAKRKTAWYGDSEYTYSNATKKPLLWTDELVEIKKVVESLAGTKFNSCLLNLYEDGDVGLGWHSDDENGVGPVIASVSLGAERVFHLRHKQTNEVVKIALEDRSLLVMAGDTQKNWMHCVPKSKKVHGPRINLTFRDTT